MDIDILNDDLSGEFFKAAQQAKYILDQSLHKTPHHEFSSVARTETPALDATDMPCCGHFCSLAARMIIAMDGSFRPV